MRLIIIALLVLGGWLGAASAQEVRENAPSSYSVVKGDTLWGISGRFLKQPWRWPEVWNMNREQIRNPHLIYPGNIIYLTYVGGKPRLSLGRGGTVKLSPQVRVESLDRGIPSIPSAVIEPFLTRPLVIEEDQLEESPLIVATESERVIIGTGNKAYVEGLDAGQGDLWQVYRPGPALTDPDTGSVLGYEAVYLGDAQVIRRGDPATVSIVRSTQEINQGDRLVAAGRQTYPQYVPHAPDKKVVGRVMSTTTGVSEIGRNAIITINRGSQDGIEVGHVLASYAAGELVRVPRRTKRPAPLPSSEPLSPSDGDIPPTKTSLPLEIGLGSRGVQLPEERNGLVFVFRTFEKISYGLVVQSSAPLHVGDTVRTPE